LSSPAAARRGKSANTALTIPANRAMLKVEKRAHREEAIMYLKQRDGDHLVEVLSTTDLYNPMHDKVVGRVHYGEEPQDPEKYPKSELIFPSGEDLPRCWTDVHYRDDEATHHYRK
jgi:hypothetical protein